MQKSETVTDLALISEGQGLIDASKRSLNTERVLFELCQQTEKNPMFDVLPRRTNSASAS